MNKTRNIQFKLSQEDHDILEKVASKQRCTMAEFARRQTMPAAEKALERMQQ